MSDEIAVDEPESASCAASGALDDKERVERGGGGGDSVDTRIGDGMVEFED